jgi:TolB-like protein/Tfp pilus assembly protein PilF
VTAIPLESGSEPDQNAIREELGRILNSGPFAQSRRRQRFLEYIVNETLAGRGDRLKGYKIAVEVFDRPETFDPVTDPLVRIEAARLREKLREYYDTDGRNDPVVIELPKGAYTPHVAFRQQEAVDTGGRPGGVQRMRWRVAAVALIALLAAAGAWLYGHPWAERQEEIVADRAADTPKGPAIAVLPFTNLSGDPKQDYFSDGLTEDILTELSGARDLRVIARNTTFQYKGKAVDVRKLGQELNVRYVLEGSARRSDDSLRVSAQLIDTGTGAHIWAERYDREMADVLLVQDEIVTQIVAKIAGSYGAIERNDAKAALRKSPDEIEAYDLVLRAHDIMQWDWTPANFGAARAALNQAIALDPSNPKARRELAWLAVIGWVFRLDDKPVPPEEITAQAAKAVTLDPTDARARMVAASAYFFTKQLDRFKHESDEALKRAPYDAEIIAVLACMLSASGDRERGVALAKKARALNADASIGWYHSTIYTADYLKGDYAHALEVAQQNFDQEMFYSHLEIIPIYGQLGRKDDALAAWRNLQKLYPGASAQTFEGWWRFWNMQDQEVEKLMDGVHKSGVLAEEPKPSQ